MKQHEPVLHRQSLPGRLGRAVVLVCLAGLGLTSGAWAARIQMSHFPPNPGVLPGGGWKMTPGTTFADPPPPRMWVDGVLSGVRNVAATDTLTLAGRAGPLVVQARQALTVAEAAGAVARCVMGSVPVCAAATSAAAVVLAANRIRKAMQGDGLEADAGQDQIQETGYMCFNTRYPNVARQSGSTAVQACQNQATAYTNGSPGAKTTYANGTSDWRVFTSNSQLQLFQSYCTSTSGCGAPTFLETQTASSTTINLCPAVVDFSDPRYSQKGGPPGADGKCPTGRYQASSETEAVAKVAAYPPPVGDAGFVQAVKDAIDTGGQTSPSELSLSGPASQTGTPVSTSTTSPTGTVTETKTPTYTYNYGGDTITYNESNTTVVNNNGQTTTTTTTGTAPKPQDPNDPCTANPGRVGCTDLGKGPDDQVSKKNKTLTFSPEGVGLPAGCPADQMVSTSKGSYAFSYAMTCDAAVRAAPWVRAGGAIAAMLLVLAALREL